MSLARPRRAGSAIGAVVAGLILATLLNGAGVYLKRTGLMEADAYRAYWSFHCSTLPLPHSSEAAGPRCRAQALPIPQAPLEASARARGERAQTRFIYRTPGTELALKLVKDAFGFAVLAMSLALLLRRVAALPTFAHCWPVSLVLAYAAAAGLASLALYEPLIALAGARYFMFFGLALAGLWLVPHMALLALAVAFLLALQLLLMPFEMLRGVHLHGHFHQLPLAGRLGGTLVAPNSLGAFAVCSLAFWYAFAPSRRWLWLMALMALLLVLLGGSGAGMLGLGVFLAMTLFERFGAEHRRLLVLAGGPLLLALVVLLPDLLGRPRLFESLWGRIGGLGTILADRSIWSVVFGSGLGVDTNTAGMLVRMLGSEGFPRYARLPSGAGESMLASLLVQIGLVGTLLFYGSLMWAAVRDRQARVFYAVVVVCSLVLQVAELFPVNFLLGVALAHSVAVVSPNRATASHA